MRTGACKRVAGASPLLPYGTGNIKFAAIYRKTENAVIRGLTPGTLYRGGVETPLFYRRGRRCIGTLRAPRLRYKDDGRRRVRRANRHATRPALYRRRAGSVTPPSPPLYIQRAASATPT